MNKIFRIISILLIILILASILSKITYDQYVYTQLDTSEFPLEQKWSIRVDSQVLELSGDNDGDLVFARTSRTLYAIDSKTGQEIWRFSLFYQNVPSPAIENSEVVYITDSKMLWALKKTSGDVIWSQLLSKVNKRVVSASEKIILVCGTSSDVSAFDAINGSLLWTYPVYWRHDKFYVSENAIYIPEDGIYVIDLATGKTLQEKGADAITDSRFDNSVIYYVTTDGVVAFNIENKAEIWRHSLELSRYGLPKMEIYDKFILVMDMDTVFKLDRSTGNLLWKTSSSAPLNPAIIGDNIFIVEGFNKEIQVFQIETGKEIGSLVFSGRQFLLADSQQKMIALRNMLYFSRGKELFGFVPKDITPTVPPTSSNP